MKNIAIFVSGRGSNFKSLLNSIDAGHIPAVISCVISDKANPPAFDIAKDGGIPTRSINRKQYSYPSDYSDAILAFLDKYKIDLIVLAGYMRLIPSVIVAKYRQAIMNIHPALLPNFGGKGYYGMKVHARVIETGVKITGVTVHFVDEHYDTGPIILQKSVEVLQTDTPESLAARVLKVEHRVYPEAVKAYCEDRLVVDGRKVLWKN